MQEILHAQNPLPAIGLLIAALALALVVPRPIESGSRHHASMHRFELPMAQVQNLNPGADLGNETQAGTGQLNIDMSESAVEEDAEHYEVREPNLKLATRDTWIWDYNDTPATGFSGPTPIAMNVLTGNDDASAGGTGSGPGNKIKRLDRPVYSITSSTHDLLAFELQLTLSNPNPDGVSEILWAVTGADSVGEEPQWSVYSGGVITVAPGDTVMAYVKSLHQNWTDSYESAGSGLNSA